MAVFRNRGRQGSGGCSSGAPPAGAASKRINLTSLAPNLESEVLASQGRVGEHCHAVCNEELLRAAGLPVVALHAAKK